MNDIPGSYMEDREPPLHGDTSVEKALNSRCSSDVDGDPKSGHWGMYDSETPVPLEHLHALDRAVQVPRFTHHRLSVDFDQRPIVLAIPTGVSDIDHQWLHVESGMQQQAIHLVCAALGMGTCIYNLGTQGRYMSEDLWGTVRMGLEMMRPSYNGSLWSTDPPDDWISDPSLPDPRRDGGFSLLRAMEDLTTSSRGRSAELADISQLLWAARGRTPHVYMARRWGLTIPTWGGIQGIASLHLASRDGIFRYVNWRNDRPTHALERTGDPSGSQAPDEIQIVLSVNEDSGRALWEVGYMLENLLAQAVSLGIQFDAALLTTSAAARFEAAGVPGAMGMLTCYTT